jgi:hypothetical protein
MLVVFWLITLCCIWFILINGSVMFIEFAQKHKF